MGQCVGKSKLLDGDEEAEHKKPKEKKQKKSKHKSKEVEQDNGTVVDTKTDEDIKTDQTSKDVNDKETESNKPDNKEETETTESKEDGEESKEVEVTTNECLEKFREDNTIDSVEFFKVFMQYDEDKTGYLEATELKNFLKDLLKDKGKRPDEESLDKYLEETLKEIDIEKDYRIELGELALILPVEQNFLTRFPARESWTKEELDDIFTHYDKDCSGSIAGVELLALLKDAFDKNGQSMTSKQVQEYAEIACELYEVGPDGALSRDDIGLLLTKM